MQKIDEENARLELEAKVFRTFQTNQMGILNYDALYKAKDPLYATVDFTLDFIQDQEMYTGGKIYFVPESRRAVLTLHNFTNQYLAIDKSDKNVRIFTLLPGGEVGIIDSLEMGQLDFEKITASQKPEITLKFRKWDAQITSEDDVNKLFGI
jgi:hypothetical protein